MATYRPDPEFQALYNIYTADPDSIGTHLNSCLGARSADDPLLVSTGSDIVIFPGGGRPPQTESFRLSTRGFIEITGISHLGVAVPYLIRLKELGHPAWESDIRRLIAQARRVRRVEFGKLLARLRCGRGLGGTGDEDYRPGRL